MRHRTLRAGLPIAAMSLLAATVPGIAAADGAARPAGPDQHCNFDVRSGEQHCFGSLDEAEADARVRGSAHGGATAQGDIIQATLFDEENFAGASFTVYGTGMCEKNDKVDYQIDLPDDWKNRISSVQPWADCWIWLYPEPGLGGDRDGPFKENTGAVGGALNDRAQSVGLS